MGQAAISLFRLARKANPAADVRALIAIAVLVVSFSAAQAQGPPDVVWQSAYPTGNVTSIGYAPNGQSIFTGESDKAANLWRASDGLSLWRVRHGQNGCGSVSDVAYSADNTIVATLNGCTLKL